MTSIRYAKKHKIKDFAENAPTIAVRIADEVTLDDLAAEGIDYDIRGQQGTMLKSCEAKLNDFKTRWLNFTYNYYPDASKLPDYSIPNTLHVPRQWIQKCA